MCFNPMNRINLLIHSSYGNCCNKTLSPLAHDEGTGGGELTYFLDVKIQSSVRYAVTLITVPVEEGALPTSKVLMGWKRANCVLKC